MPFCSLVSRGRLFHDINFSPSSAPWFSGGKRVHESKMTPLFSLQRLFGLLQRVPSPKRNQVFFLKDFLKNERQKATLFWKKNSCSDEFWEWRFGCAWSTPSSCELCLALLGAPRLFISITTFKLKIRPNILSLCLAFCRCPRHCNGKPEFICLPLWDVWLNTLQGDSRAWFAVIPPLEILFNVI